MIAPDINETETEKTVSRSKVYLMKKNPLPLYLVDDLILNQMVFIYVFIDLI